MALNFSRNTKLYVSTVNAGWTTGNTFLIPILDGYSFSQDAASQEITLNEAGASPVRGQKIFNTALNPVDISFTTYVQPTKPSNHSCVEKVLWAGLVGDSLTANTVEASTEFTVDFEGSDVHQLLKLYMYFELDNTTYRVDNVVLNSAEIDFSIDGIAQITWTGQGTAISEQTAPTTFASPDSSKDFIVNKLSTIELQKTTSAVSAVWTVDYGAATTLTTAHTLVDSTTYTADITIDGGSAQTISIEPVAAGISGGTVGDVIDEINAQLTDAWAELLGGNIIVTSATAGTASTVLITDGGVNPLFATLDTGNFVSIGSETTNGSGTPIVYSIPITGGSLTVDNGVTFLTPEELAVVNTPLDHFTGTRSVSGTLTAYLNTGTTNSGGLLSNLVSDTSTVTQEFEMTIHMGGPTGNHVDFIMNHAHLVIPSINVEDVISTEINFTALGEDIDVADELIVKYYGD